ncbi:hypothetical protein ACRN9J_18420 [Shewanella baltica]|uniref:hypothetical protein n=1 Tax=Shewanella baltica TaxID=62322 RepID=UPI0024BB950D|nr:hypothetical protein [Shewanella baltica]
MNVNKQFFWFLMNAVLMCIFILPVAAAFWLSAFTAGFDWSQWVKMTADAVNEVANEPTKALVTVQTYWGILSFFLLAAYSYMFKFKAKAQKEQEAFAGISSVNEIGVSSSGKDTIAASQNQ